MIEAATLWMGIAPKEPEYPLKSDILLRFCEMCLKPKTESDRLLIAAVQSILTEDYEQP